MEKLWIDLKPYWPFIEKEANRRDAEKRRYASTRLMNTQSHLVGLAGEYAFALAAGRQPNLMSKPQGDDGMAFPDLEADVKTSVHHEEPWLRISCKDPLKATWYVLVGLDVFGRRTYVAGYAHREEVRYAQRKNMGYGPTWVLPCTALAPFSGSLKPRGK